VVPKDEGGSISPAEDAPTENGVVPNGAPNNSATQETKPETPAENGVPIGGPNGFDDKEAVLADALEKVGNAVPADQTTSSEPETTELAVVPDSSKNILMEVSGTIAVTAE